MSKLLKELKTKLAEKEEYIELLLEEKAGYLDLISGYADKCKQLKQQLTEMTKKYELASLPMGGLVDTARNLEKQLAEKEKYIEEQEFAEYKEKFYATQELKEDCELKILELEKQLEEKDKLLMQKIGKMKSTDFIRMCVNCGLMIRAYTTKEDNNANNRKTQNPTSKM